MPIEDLKAWFQARGFDEQFSLYAAESVELLIVVALAFVANLIAKRIILQLVRRLVAKVLVGIYMFALKWHMFWTVRTLCVDDALEIITRCIIARCGAILEATR